MSNLENELSTALTSDTVTAAELSALIIKVQAKIMAADNEAKLNQERVYDLASNPKEAHAAMEEAVITSGRLNTALTRLHRKKSATADAERVAAWEADLGPMTAKRDALAAEFVEAIGECVKLAENFPNGFV